MCLGTFGLQSLVLKGKNRFRVSQAWNVHWSLKQRSVSRVDGSWWFSFSSPLISKITCWLCFCQFAEPPFCGSVRDKRASSLQKKPCSWDPTPDLHISFHMDVFQDVGTSKHLQIIEWSPGFLPRGGLGHAQHEARPHFIVGNLDFVWCCIFVPVKAWMFLQCLLLNQPSETGISNSSSPKWFGLMKLGSPFDGHLKGEEHNDHSWYFRIHLSIYSSYILRSVPS